MALASPGPRQYIAVEKFGVEHIRTGIVVAWLAPGPGNSRGRVVDLGKVVVLASAISLVGVAIRKQGVIS